MKNQHLLFLLTVVGLLLFNFLFWQENMGVNLPLFSIFLIGLAYYKSPLTGKRKEFYFGLIGVVLTGLVLCWHHSKFSIFMHFVSVFITLATLKHKRITTVFEGIVASLITYATGPFTWYKALKEREKGNKKLAMTFSFIKLCLIPLLAFVLFFIIYKNANPKFDELTLTIT